MAKAETETPAARADRLFRDGKAALEEGRFEEACPKLLESQRLDPGTGTLLALGLCHEGSGATASAFRELTEVLEASKNRPDRASLAKAHLRALEPRLSKLTVSLGDPAARGNASLRVQLDGAELSAGRLDVPMPVDPGDHVLEASMPDATPWTSTVHLRGDGDARVVLVPKLERVAAPIAPAPVSDGSGRTVAWVVGGSGAALVAVGTVFGVLALGARSDATALCPSSPCANAQGVSDNDTAKTEAWVADLGIGLGIAGLAVGTYLWLTHPSAPASTAPASPPPETAVRVRLGPGPGMAGLSLRAEW